MKTKTTPRIRRPSSVQPGVASRINLTLVGKDRPAQWARCEAAYLAAKTAPAQREAYRQYEVARAACRSDCTRETIAAEDAALASYRRAVAVHILDHGGPMLVLVQPEPIGPAQATANSNGDYHTTCGETVV